MSCSPFTLWQMFGGRMWKRNTFLTAFAFPAMVSSVVFVLNFFVWNTVRRPGPRCIFDAVMSYSLHLFTQLGFIHCDSLHLHALNRCPVVWNINTACIPRRLFRVPKGAHDHSCGCERHSQRGRLHPQLYLILFTRTLHSPRSPDSSPTLVPTTSHRDPHWWHPPLWCRLY